MDAMNQETPFDQLDPGRLLDAVESLGLSCDGRLLPLNSYENRVYQVGLDEQPPVIVKFYRPGRWSDAAILEEHAFALELAEHEVPVVAPLVFDGATLHHREGYRLAVFPRRGGRLPELESREARVRTGRFIGRLHLVGGARRFQARQTLDSAGYAQEALDDLRTCGLVPGELEGVYFGVVEDALERIRTAFARAEGAPWIRIHGDCHPGNILWSDAGPTFVDLDDALNGPAIQDLWMLLSGSRMDMNIQLGELLEGYEDFASLDPRELHLVEALRTLRMIRFSWWLARRWNDPAFPFAFPWFGESRYWEEQILSLREQLALLDEPPLQP